MRLDLWLWAARFFKTRSLAAQAIDGGRVEVNGEHPKRSKAIKVGDQVQIRIGPYRHHVVVEALAERRGSAAVAAGLYREDPQSKAARLELAERLRVEAPTFYEGRGRPTKKQRREIDKWKGKG